MKLWTGNLAAVGLDLEEIQERIREKPIFYMAISAGIGFVAGGGTGLI
jgi:hypothetical protein